jgi:dipeptidyl aminopeptidase/acylaminoacyl peptidase
MNRAATVRERTFDRRVERARNTCPSERVGSGVECRKLVVLGVSAIASVVGAVTLASVTFCESSLHVRNRPFDTPAPVSIYSGADWRTVRIRATDGSALSAWFVRPMSEHGRKCVMVLHGIRDSRLGAAGFAPMFLARGYDVLLPDSRGHGSSEGEIVTYGVRETYDLMAWAGWMRDKGCTDLYALGESLGAAVLIQTAGLTPVFRAIVAECAFTDLRTIAIYRLNRFLLLPAWLSGVAAESIVAGGLAYTRVRYGVDLAGASPLASMKKVTTPILLIHRMNDRETPPLHSKRLAEAGSSAVLWLVPNAAHTKASAVAPGEFQRRVLDWFAQH